LILGLETTSNDICCFLERKKRSLLSKSWTSFCGKETVPSLPRFRAGIPTGSSRPEHCWRTGSPRFPPSSLPWFEPRRVRRPRWSSLGSRPRLRIRFRVGRRWSDGWVPDCRSSHQSTEINRNWKCLNWVIIVHLELIMVDDL